MLGSAAAVSAGVTGTTLAQDSAPEPKPELKLDLKVSSDDSGIYNQNLFIYESNGNGKRRFELFQESRPSGQLDFGFNYSTVGFNLDLGFRDLDNGGDIFSVSGRIHDNENCKYAGDGTFECGPFLGATYERLTNRDRGIVTGGFNLLEGKLHIQGTADTDGNARAVFYPRFDEGILAFGLALDETQNVGANVSFSNESTHLAVQIKENGTFDGRVVLGDVFPRKVNYFSRVVGKGINALHTLGDQTFQFGIGENPRFEFAEEMSMLGREPGDIALYARFREGLRAYSNLAFRVGDIGPLQNAYGAIGIYDNLSGEDFGFPDDIDGITLEGGFDIVNNAQLRAKYDFGTDSFGAFGRIEF